MAQDSGIATVINGQGGSPLGGFDPAKLMEVTMRLKQAKEQSATQDLQTALQLAEKGLIDPSSLEKKIKTWEKSSGMKMSDPGTKQASDKLAKTASQDITSDQGKAISQMSGAGVQGSGAQSSSPVGKQTAKENPAGGMETPISGSPVENYVNQIRRLQTYQGANAENKAKIDAKTSELSMAAMNGDEGARQQLQAMGTIAYDKNFELMHNASPEDKQKMVSEQIHQAEGLESPKDKQAREDNMRMSYISAGYDSKSADRLVKDPTAGVPKNFKQVAEEAKSYSDLQNSFGDEAAAKLAPALAAGASLSDVLPKVGKTQSYFSQQMAADKQKQEEDAKYKKSELGMRQQELGVRQREVGIQEKEANSTIDYRTQEGKSLVSKAEYELSKQENADFRENLAAFVQTMKNRTAIPVEIQDKYIAELGKRVGLTKVESRSFLNHLTFGYFGQSEAWGPDIESGKKVLDEAFSPSGKKQDASNIKDVDENSMIKSDVMGSLKPDQIEAMKKSFGNFQQ